MKGCSQGHYIFVAGEKKFTDVWLPPRPSLKHKLKARKNVMKDEYNVMVNARL